MHSGVTIIDNYIVIPIPERTQLAATVTDSEKAKKHIPIPLRYFEILLDYFKDSFVL